MTGATISQRRQSRLLQQRLVMRQYMEAKVLHPAVDARNMLLYGLSPHEVDDTGMNCSCIRVCAHLLVACMVLYRGGSMCVGCCCCSR